MPQNLFQEFIEEFEPVETKATFVLEEGQTLISEKRLDPVHAKHIGERLNRLETHVGTLLETYKKEHERYKVS